MAEQLKDFLLDNYLIVIAAGMMILAVVILLVVMIRGRRSRQNPNEDGGFGESGLDIPPIGGVPDPSFSPQPGGMYGAPSGPGSDEAYAPHYSSVPDRGFPSVSSGLEKTVAETRPWQDPEKTVDESSMLDNEKTVDGSMKRGSRVAFHISFCGRMDTVERFVNDALVLGRGDKCDVDVVLGQRSEEAKQTSRAHAVVINRPEGLFVRDEESHNGTVLNGMVLRDEQPLRNGDVLQMGKAIVQIGIDPSFM